MISVLGWIVDAFGVLFAFIGDLPGLAAGVWSEHPARILVAGGYAAAGYAGYKAMPHLAHRYAVRRRDEAAATGEVRVAGLEAARVLATGDVALEPAKLASAISAARLDPDRGVWLSYVLGEHTDPVISGRNIEPVVSAILAEYPGAQVEWIEDPREVYAVPGLSTTAGGSGSAPGTGPEARDPESLNDVYRVYGITGEQEIGISTIEEQAACVRRGEDPIEPAVVSVEDAIEPASGEWAEVALHIRPASRGSVKELSSRELNHKEEVGTAAGGGSKLGRGLLGGILWIAGAKSFGARILMGGGSPAGSNSNRYRETEQSKQVKVRAQSRRHFTIRPVARGRVRPGREEQLERAFDAYFSRAEKAAGASIEPKKRPGRYEKPALTELKLAGPRFGRRQVEPVLTASETAALWHPLGAGAHTRRQRKSYLKTIPPSPRLPKSGPFLAKTNHPGAAVDLRFDLGVLPSHVRFRGIPGTGKSTLQFQAAEAILSSPGLSHKKMGMVLLDPKYSLYRAVLENFPEGRDDDVIVLNAASDLPMPGYNLLIPEPGLDAEAVAESLVEILETRWPQGFGPRMRPIMVRSVKTMVYGNVEAMRGGEEPPYNLSHLSRSYFLALPEEDGVSPEFRAGVLARLYERNEEFESGTGPYEQLLRDWEAFEALGARKQEEYTQPITNKIDALFSSASVRRLFGVNHKDFTLKEVLEDGRIVLFNLAKSVYRGSTGYIAGTIFLSLLLEAAISRYGAAAENGVQDDLRECVMFIDEVQNFLCTQMTDIINEGRAYKIPMVVAHQETSQIGSDELKEAMEAAKTQVYFCTTLADGTLAAKRIGGDFTGELMSQMPDFNFVYTSEGGLQVTARTVPIPKNPRGPAVAADVAEISSENWASPGKEPTPVPRADAFLLDAEEEAAPEEGWFYANWRERGPDDEDERLEDTSLAPPSALGARAPENDPGGGIRTEEDGEDEDADVSRIAGMLEGPSWEELQRGRLATGTLDPPECPHGAERPERMESEEWAEAGDHGAGGYTDSGGAHEFRDGDLDGPGGAGVEGDRGRDGPREDSEEGRDNGPQGDESNESDDGDGGGFI